MLETTTDGAKKSWYKELDLEKKRLKKHVRHSSNADRNVAKHLNNLFISLFEEWATLPCAALLEYSVVLMIIIEEYIASEVNRKCI